MPRLKLPRFGLRMLLIATIGLGSAIGYYVQRTQSQFRATQWILSNEGNIYYDYEIDQSKLNQEDVRGNGWSPPPWQKWEAPAPGPEFLRERLGIDYFATVVGVDVSDSNFPIQNLAQLKAFSDLQLLTIGVPDSDNLDFSAVSELPEIRRLEVHYSALRDLSFIESAHKLRVISLWDTGIRDIQSLSNLKNLERIEINSLIENTAPLAGLTKLKSITINTMDFDIDDFRKLKELEYLDLDVANCRYSQTQLGEFNQMLPKTQIFIRSNKKPYFESEFYPQIRPAG